jgi:hypothetical protein
MAMEPDTSKAWPHYLLRVMMQDDASTMEDLIWSVGGSPPYGGIPHEEAEAVFQLIEDYRGAGEAPPERYVAVRKVVRGHPERQQVLDLFECYDKIVSASDSYSQDAVDAGLAIAKSMEDPACIGLFMLFGAGIMSRERRNADAARVTLEALDLLLMAADENPAARRRVEQAAQNAVALTALAGDVPKASELLDTLADVLSAESATQLRRWIAAQR